MERFISAVTVIMSLRGRRSLSLPLKRVIGKMDIWAVGFLVLGGLLIGVFAWNFFEDR
jgi:hypothetical protein